MRFCTASAIRAYEAMLDEVRVSNPNLTGGEPDAKLRAARDDYVRSLRGGS